MENVRNLIKADRNKKDDDNKKIEQQSKLIFNGNLKSYTNYDRNLLCKMKPSWISHFI